MTTTFKQFIKEDEKIFNIEQFVEDCSYVLDLLKPFNLKLLPWHGTRIGAADFDIITWSERTKPRNTPQFVHNKLNDWALNKFGDPMRNWRFITGDKDTARHYGAIYAIFPIGKFEWICASDDELSDLTVAYDDILSDEEPDKILAVDVLLDKMNNVRWQHNTNFRRSLDSGVEIMFKCQQYYMLSVEGKAFKEVIDYINK